MQLLFDLFPIIVFVVIYKMYDLYVATGAIMVAMALQVAIQWFRQGEVSKMLAVSTVLVIVFGSITLLLRNPLFIQWKPTVVNWLFAAVFLGSRYIGKQCMIERMMGHAIELSVDLWRQLNMMWVLNFVVLGAANIYVVYNFDEATWVNFKLYGMLGLTLVMVVAQAVWISAHLASREKEEQEK